MTEAAAALLYFAAAALARLPWPLLRALADAMAALWRRADVREARVVRRNLELAFPALSPAEREALLATTLRTTARQLLETLRVWTRPPARNLAAIVQGEGIDLFDAALASGAGVIVAAPHHGNWELLNQWLASRTPLAILYKPPQSAIGEAFLRRVRAAHGDAARITQVPAQGPAIRSLVRQLRAGGVVGILPDQQPRQGDGEFAPFFGIPALTMTLLPRLAHSSGARVLLATCVRIGEDARGPRFALRIERIDDAGDGPAAINAAIERAVRREPAQYQWTYKRWSIAPVGDPRGNPYWPDCYPRRTRRAAAAHDDAP